MTLTTKSVVPIAYSATSGLFPRTRRSLAEAAQALETRRRIVRELALLSDRSLADIGIYRCDINAFAAAATRDRRAQPLPAALLADLRALLRMKPVKALAPKAAE